MGWFTSEKEFEQHIRLLLNAKITMPENGIQLLDSKGIGDIVLYRDGRCPQVFFVEIKYASYTPSGELNSISVSEGIQSEILLKRPHYLENHYMWLLGSESRECEYLLMNTEDLLTHVTTRPISVNKMNNISLKIFHGDADEHKLDEEELILSLLDFVNKEPTII